ncbi:hypothetical protein [Sphingomonas kyeonggiensis]|uniref:Uncharacterized protein n=1 Tax=Sphingomonas kyeonggiensis TaxID=1268553 RepID=A0A7W6JZT7_9SPHN|nr:hypothetical protein [Sphingomonas kyeonggiensis]MBB4101477.1 hypothetical protein [Sphingomonas kyeonggiensis]
MIALSFWALTLLCCAIAARYGGRHGIRIAIVYLLGCLATVPAAFLDRDWHHTALATFAVDAVVLMALWWVALKADRWFPLWVAGFHVVTVTSHIASLFVPGYMFEFYFVLQGFWSVPMLLVMAGGALLDRRAGVVDEPAAGDHARGWGFPAGTRTDERR